MSMDEEEAKKILKEHSSPAYYSWHKGDTKATVDGRFTAEELEAIAYLLRKDI